jgi:multiple RNA-binding domain-containing protein 1
MQDVQPEPRQDDVSDLEWMKQRMSKNVDVIEKAFEQSDDEGEPTNKDTLVKQPHFFYLYHTDPVR